MKNLEIKTIEYKGINITVKIDYDQGQISLVERRDYSNKKWLFSGRGVSYMNEWCNILDAMKHAIKEAEKELELYQKEKVEKSVEFIQKANQFENE